MLTIQQFIKMKIERDKQFIKDLETELRKDKAEARKRTNGKKEKKGRRVREFLEG